MKKRILAIILVTLLLLAGCSGETSTDSSTDAAKEKEVVIGLLLAQSSLDPQYTVDGSSMIAESVIYDTLVNTGGGLQTICEPMLATDWTISDDGLTYVFELRQGVKFHNGDEMTANDVVYTLDRVRESDVTASKFATICNVEATGDYEVTITLSSPDAMLLPYLGDVATGIVSEKAINDANGDPFKAVGTGPYMLDGECKSGQPFSVVAFPDYWGGTPEIERVSYRVLPDSSTAVIALQNGEIDLLPDLNVNDLATVQNDPNLDTVEATSNWFVHLTFNKSKAPFDDIRVRQAIEYAINKQDIMDAAYDGVGELANSPLCSIMLGYTDELEFNKYDPEKAKELLAEAGYPDGFSTTVLARTDRSYVKKVAQVLQSELADVGINLEIKEMERAAWNEAQSTVNFDISIGCLNWGDSYSMLSFLYKSDGDHNFDRTYNNPEVDALLEAAKQESNMEKAAELYRQIVVLADADRVVVPIFFPKDIIGINAKLKGVVYTVNCYFRADEWTLDG